jgi:ubiquinone/menaquinone biosynthesis C-methylase UbiE
MSRSHSKVRPTANTTTSSTSWQAVGSWYDQLVGESGHYYHQQVIFPQLAKRWQPTDTTRVLDLGCGQGILAAWLAKKAEYLGIDAAKKLIESARARLHSSAYHFVQADVTKPLAPQLDEFMNTTFTDAFCILALQNMADPKGCLANAAALLADGGTLHLVLNHPCFRIPRQTGWGEHSGSRQSYRWVNRYLSSLKIPILAHPGKPNGPMTWSFHYSLSQLSQWLSEAGFLITAIDEWTSDKQSQGKVAKQENLSRREIPLFMYIKAVKKTKMALLS